MNQIDFLRLIGIKYLLTAEEKIQNTSDLVETSKDITSNSVNPTYRGKLSNTLQSLNKNLVDNLVDEVFFNPKLIKPQLESPLDATTENLVLMIRKQVQDISSIEDLKQFVLNFEHCKLKLFATNTVFADGNPNSPRLMIIGEAPGEKEDLNALPFCGRSGALLDKILFALNLSRSKNCYVTNTVFWRPPANRRPTREEIEICRPIVEKHIALVQPKMILLAGNTAIHSLLSSDMKISYFQGKITIYNNIYLTHQILLTAIFHPSYMLRQGSKKKDTWKSLLKIKKFLQRNNIDIF